MNLRHAAALALVGWYLMVPPTGRDNQTRNADAPLSQWKRRPTIYRDKEECEHVLERQHRLTYSSWAKAYEHAQCVASDDSRLKEK